MTDTLINAQQMQLYARSSNYVALARALNDAANRWGINTPRRLRHWLAHMYVESGAFTVLEENLNYSAERLVAVWPHRFPNLETAAPFAHSPQALANSVYGGRMGNVQPGDGWSFRGSGLLDTTGRANFAATTKGIGVDVLATPNLMRADYTVAAHAAGWFWTFHGLNEISDADSDEKAIADAAQRINVNEIDDVVAETRVVNGGLIGLDARKQALRRAGAIAGWRD